MIIIVMIIMMMIVAIIVHVLGSMIVMSGVLGRCHIVVVAIVTIRVMIVILLWLLLVWLLLLLWLLLLFARVFTVIRRRGRLLVGELHQRLHCR